MCRGNGRRNSSSSAGAFSRGTPLRRGFLLTYATSALVCLLHLFWCVLLIPPKRPRQIAGFLFRLRRRDPSICRVWIPRFVLLSRKTSKEFKKHHTPLRATTQRVDGMRYSSTGSGLPVRAAPTLVRYLIINRRSVEASSEAADFPGEGVLPRVVSAACSPPPGPRDRRIAFRSSQGA